MRWKRYALAFLATAATGLAVRVYAQDIVTGLFGANTDDWLFILLPEIGGLLLPALVTLVVGYALPRGFFLWGVAVVLLHPLFELTWNNRAVEAGVIEPSELGGLIIFQTARIVLFAGVCTGAAAIGAGLRLLWWWLRGVPIGAPVVGTEGENTAR